MPAPPERSVLVSAARSAAIIRDFAQNGFALRSVIATNLKTGLNPVFRLVVQLIL
jgi:hypothetical protein